MNKDRIKKLAESPKFISGIYNYCDRWCERCIFTARCLNYAIDEEQYDTPESRDIANKLFWDKLHETFQITLELIKDMAEKEGIDLDSADVSDSVNQEEENFQKANKHALSLLSNKYTSDIQEWFDNSDVIFKTKANELDLKVRLNLSDNDPLLEADNIKNDVEVIRWYLYQINVKIVRALHGKFDDMNELFGFDDFPKDSDGSAKVALLGIDRSIAAWGELLNYFPEQEDQILNFILILERLRRGLEFEFPDARAFVRPGFDEMN